MATYTYTDILNGEVAVGAPVDTALMTALRDNALAIAEQADAGLPDEVKGALLLATGGTFVTFSGLDLTGYNFVLVTADGIQCGSTARDYDIASKSILVVPSFTNSLSFGAFVSLDDGVIINTSNAATVTGRNSTGISRATTSITCGGSFTAGTTRLYGVK